MHNKFWQNKNFYAKLTWFRKKQNVNTAWYNCMGLLLQPPWWHLLLSVPHWSAHHRKQRAADAGHSERTLNKGTPVWDTNFHLHYFSLISDRAGVYYCTEKNHIPKDINSKAETLLKWTERITWKQTLEEGLIFCPNTPRFTGSSFSLWFITLILLFFSSSLFHASLYHIQEESVIVLLLLEGCSRVSETQARHWECTDQRVSLPEVSLSLYPWQKCCHHFLRNLLFYF